MTIKQALYRAEAQLLDISDSAHLDAERLLLHVLKQDNPSWFVTHADNTLSPIQQQEFEKLVQQRATGKPLAYIIGTWEFYGREFIVTPEVLVPRPETEELVEKALQVIAEMNNKYNRPITVADIGTGSGCIAITLLKEWELGNRNYELDMIATDISTDALAVARRNAEKHGVADRIEFLQGDMLASVRGRQVDLIVSNPPYVPTGEIKKAGHTPETQGLLFEPQQALDGGPDGQKFVEALKNAGIPMILEGTGGRIIRA